MRSEVWNMERILNICEKICYFFLINFLFLLSNLPVLFFFLFIGISQVSVYLPLFMICLLPMPLSLSAVFYAMNRLIRGTEGKAFRDYMKGYKTDVFQRFKLGAGHLFVLFVLWTNIRFFTKIVPSMVFTILFVLLFAFGILIIPNLYLLSSRYVMGSRELIWTACILTVTRPVCTLGTLASWGIVLAAFEVSAGTTVLFMASIYGFLVDFISQRMLESLEKRR